MAGVGPGAVSLINVKVTGGAYASWMFCSTTFAWHRGCVKVGLGAHEMESLLQLAQGSAQFRPAGHNKNGKR